MSTADNFKAIKGAKDVNSGRPGVTYFHVSGVKALPGQHAQLADEWAKPLDLAVMLTGLRGRGAAMVEASIAFPKLSKAEALRLWTATMLFNAFESERSRICDDLRRALDRIDPRDT